MTVVLSNTFINNTYAQVNLLKQAPSSWYENPTFAYIPVIGVLISSFAQFSFNAQLDKFEKAFKDIRATPLTLGIQKKVNENWYKRDQLIHGIVQPINVHAVESEKESKQLYENRNREIEELEQKVKALQQQTSEFASKAVKLIKMSNHHAIVSIIQDILLSAIVISIVALRILNPAIGVPIFLLCALITAGHSGILAKNKLERIQQFNG